MKGNDGTASFTMPKPAMMIRINPMISNAAIIFAMIRIVQSDDPSVFMPKL